MRPVVIKGLRCGQPLQILSLMSIKSPLIHMASSVVPDIGAKHLETPAKGAGFLRSLSPGVHLTPVSQLGDFGRTTEG